VACDADLMIIQSFIYKKINGFDSEVTNEGTKENQVQEGNENVNIGGMMN
jgi:hypothetical protein